MQRFEQTLKILGELIAYPTISADSNLKLISYARKHLEALGADCVVQQDKSGNKANLFATIGPKCDAGIVLSGHTDVVPVAGQPWNTNPFVMHTQDGKSYGRGACDMKGFVAAALASAPDFARLHREGKLTRPLHFAFTYDEEVGCLGGKELIRMLQQLPYKPAVAIVGEPTSMGVVQAHKGSCSYDTTFTGQSGHTSLPHLGVNAIHYAVEYINKLFALGQQLQQRVPANSPFIPPYTTIQVGQIEGGVAHNVIPESCKVRWGMRPIHQSDRDLVLGELQTYVEQVLLPQMRLIASQAQIRTKTMSDVVGLIPMQHNQAVELLSNLCGADSPQAVSFGTEAGMFQQIGIATVVCGPGSIEQAHKANEYLTHQQLEAALDMIASFQDVLVGD